MKPKKREMLVMFLVADHWHKVSKIEWRTVVMVTTGEDHKDTYTMDYELEWLRAVTHYNSLEDKTPIEDFGQLSVFDVVAPVKDPIYGLKIITVDDHVPDTKRDIELAELRK